MRAEFKRAELKRVTQLHCKYQFWAHQTDTSSGRSIQLISLSDFTVCFVLKMSSAYYVCCIYLNDSKTTLNMEAKQYEQHEP